MQSTVLIIEDNAYELSNLTVVSNPETFSDRVIQFCKQWTDGKTSFEIQTSGSTGKPKAIKLERSSMIASAKASAKAIDLKAGETSLVCLDPNYIAGMMMLVRSLEVGMNIIAVEPSANPFAKLEIKDQIHFTALVPYQVKAILDSPQKEYFNQLETAIIGGAPLDEPTKKKLQNFSCQFYETYGMTETISHVALKKLNGKAKSDYFEILPGITIRQDERACLCIKAPYLPDEIITNDVVELKSLQEFIWLGRFDNVINSGGVKIFPESTEKKIANAFLQLNFKNEFFIAGLPDDRLGQSVTLIAEGSLSHDQQQVLETKLKKELLKFEIPRSIKTVQKFVRTENGKINRSKTIARIFNPISSSSAQNKDAQDLQ
ncbi:MAG: AMP-binding protein [Cyclobacteriaceae bacterium]